MAARLEAAGCPRGKIRLQPLGVEVPMRPPPRDRRVEGPVVRFCARFVEKKGVFDALDAFAASRRRHPAARMQVVGEGAPEVEERIRRRIRETDLAGAVEVLPPVPYERLPDLFAAADLFLHPSRTASDGDTEGGAPTVIPFAAAHGLPVVSTVHADIPEVVADGRSGLLVPEGDVPALAAALDRLMADPALRRRMGEAGHAHAWERFRAEYTGRVLEAHYASLPGGG